jgi:hypothetical protein
MPQSLHGTGDVLTQCFDPWLRRRVRARAWIRLPASSPSRSRPLTSRGRDPAAAATRSSSVWPDRCLHGSLIVAPLQCIHRNAQLSDRADRCPLLHARRCTAGGADRHCRRQVAGLAVGRRHDRRVQPQLRLTGLRPVVEVRHPAAQVRRSVCHHVAGDCFAVQLTPRLAACGCVRVSFALQRRLQRQQNGAVGGAWRGAVRVPEARVFDAQHRRHAAAVQSGV